MGNKALNEYNFNSSTTAETVVGEQDLSGRHFLITGCNTGIGFETARVLYRAGAFITMACRNQKKMELAKEKLEKKKDKETDGVKYGSIDILVLDLSSLKKVRESVEEYRQTFPDKKIDTLILNAGVMDVSKGLSEDGFEIHMAINHFGHSLLTFLLLPLMNDKEGNRIVVLSSMAHSGGEISFDDMDFRTRSYEGFKAYGQSKLANIAFTKELNKRLKESNKQIEVFAVHPGIIKTELGRDSFRVKLFYTFGALFWKSIPQGAATSIFGALDQRLGGKGGSYLSDCGIGKVKEGKLNDEINKRFFKVTEERIGQNYPFDEEREEVEGEEEDEDEEKEEKEKEKEEEEEEEEEEEG